MGTAVLLMLGDRGHRPSLGRRTPGAGLWLEGRPEELQERRGDPEGPAAEGAGPDSYRQEARKPGRQPRGGRQRSQGAAEKHAQALPASPPTLQIVARRPAGQGSGEKGVLQPARDSPWPCLLGVPAPWGLRHTALGRAAHQPSDKAPPQVPGYHFHPGGGAPGHPGERRLGGRVEGGSLTAASTVTHPPATSPRSSDLSPGPPAPREMGGSCPQLVPTRKGARTPAGLLGSLTTPRACPSLRLGDRKGGRATPGGKPAPVSSPPRAGGTQDKHLLFPSLRLASGKWGKYVGRRLAEACPCCGRAGGGSWPGAQGSRLGVEEERGRAAGRPGQRGGSRPMCPPHPLHCPSPTWAQPLVPINVGGLGLGLASGLHSAGLGRRRLEPSRKFEFALAAVLAPHTDPVSAHAQPQEQTDHCQ